MQHGPIQVGFFVLHLDDFSKEHLIWSHSLHFVHCTDVFDSFLLHTVQNSQTVHSVDVVVVSFLLHT